MSKLNRNVLMLFKIQPTLDTDPTPTAALNALLASNFTINAIQANFADRENLFPYFGNSGKVQVSAYSTISFDVELQSAGAAGTAPAFGPLLRGCAMAETINAAVSVVYNPITSTHEMLTFYYYLDGILFKLLNAKGTVSFNFNALGIPKATFNFTGTFVQPTDTAIPGGAVYTGFKAPLAINKVNTPTLTLHGVAAKTQNLTVDLANEVVYRNLIGSETIIITDRAPVGDISFELETVAFKDWYTTIKAGTLAALQLIHGSVAGSIVQVDAPKVQLLDPSFSETDAITMFNAKLNLQPNTGNDELILTFK